MKSDDGRGRSRWPVLEALGLYLAAGWALLEFASWADTRYALPGNFVDRLFVVLVVILPVVGFLAWRRSPDRKRDPVRPSGDEEDPGPSVAILPFANLSDDLANAYLADGISDEILTALAKVEGLHVASRTSSLLYRDSEEDIRTIARKLDVAAVLEGSVQRAGNRLRVTTRLVDGGSGYELWSARWDEEMEDIFRIEEEIARGTARALSVLLQDATVPRTDIRAYEHYLRGRQFYYDTRKKSLEFARELFERAIREEPEFALAHAALADTITLEHVYYPGVKEQLGRAEEASLRALELAPDRPEPHVSRGMVLFQQEHYDEAEEEFRTALKLDPRSFDASYFLGRMYFQTGRMELAARHFDDSHLKRDEYQGAFFSGQALEALGKEEEAGERYRSALAATEAHMELNPDDPRAATMRAVSLVRLDRVEEGLEWGRRAVAIDPEDALVRYNVACMHAVAGQTEEAVALVQDAVRVGFGNREWLEKDPDLASIREDPRIQTLLAGM